MEMEGSNIFVGNKSEILDVESLQVAKVGNSQVNCSS